MTVYRRNPLLMTVMGANPGGPAFIVIDSITGRVMYTKRATGTGGQAIKSCADVAQRLARKNNRSYIVFLDMSRQRVGGQVNVGWTRTMGITEEVHPDGRVTRGNPPRRRQQSPDAAIDAAIGAAWARFMSGVQVSIMEIPKIFRDIKSEMSGGMTLEDAVKAVGNRYRVNRNPSGRLGVRRNPTDAENDAEYSKGWKEGYELAMRDPRAAYRWERDVYQNSDNPTWFEMGKADVIAEHRAYSRIRENPLGEAILAGATSAIVSSALQSNPRLEGSPCPTCSGSLAYQGTIGDRTHYRCRGCGKDFSTPILRRRRYRGWKATCPHGEITNRCPHCRGRRISSRIKDCPHGVSGGGPSCIRCQELFRPGGPVKNNPAIRSEWDRLTGRRRLAVLEFAGVPYDQARRLAPRAWGTLPPSIQDEVAKGWQENPRGRGGRKSRAVKANPSPKGKRRMTITVEQFANWVKRQNKPEMWRAFLAKFKGYENWTHGARARKVHLEWIDTPGVDGLWITYDGGKQPESTYIMPGNSKRKGAWKHPWDTMPDIKHDPEAGIVITKLRGKSRITDFYHK